MLTLPFFLLGLGLGSVASPVPQTQAGDSCSAEPLEAATWESLDLDAFLQTWVTENLTEAATNNVQALSSSFGAPNFFCGLDAFCNAGQPCVPVDLPSWYIMVAIQNWNNYMNSLNTAVTFASSILSLILPEIVADFYPDPKDDITPLQTISSMFTTTLGLVPFTGPVSTAATAFNAGVTFLTSRLTIPAETDRFMAWSNIASSMATVVEDYQKAVATNVRATINAPITDPDTGIAGILSGGVFLGGSQNVSQSDLQGAVTGSLRKNAIGVVLQAQRTYVRRTFNNEKCLLNDEASLCRDDGPGTGVTSWALNVVNGDGSSSRAFDAAKKLQEKYGMTKEDFLIEITNCFDENNKQQLAKPFGEVIPLDDTTRCVFNLQVCDRDAVTDRDKGNDSEVCLTL
ncbi:hypothetical protein CEP53_008182 [Fusarium sp. AF-6]|nr:hypothetical protein CEP53_008182 [Fusarium sp. AF-6]